MSERVWERVQSTIRAQEGTAGDSPEGLEPSPEKRPWMRRASTLARGALGPSLGALVGAAAALLHAHTTQALPRVIAVRFPVVVEQEAELKTIAPEALREDAIAALPAPAGGGEPRKVANPAALLALRKAQAAYVMGDKSGALTALGAFDGELSGDPLRSEAARLRTLVLQREEGVR